MNCPIDGTTLQTADRQGIEIDYCPECRGVWLDRGELDKIIERSASRLDDDGDDRSRQSDGYREPNRDNYREDYRPDDRQNQGSPQTKKKKGSLLEDLFDFG
jgi:Zn-finger nucleic acid-binding protein